MAHYLPCRSCDGVGQKGFPNRDGFGFHYYPCKACNGTGINQRFLGAYCEKCGRETTYPSDSITPPKYCRECKDIIRAERERSAAEWKITRCKLCGVDIKFHISWSNIPDTCKSCIEQEKAKWREKSCKKCGATIKYRVDWNKIPDLCKPCIEKEKAMWGEKSCKNCGTSFRYRKDWDHISDWCKPCREKEKAKWKEIRCSSCGAAFKIKLEWTNPPKHCKNCKERNVNRIKADWDALLRTATLASGRRGGYYKPAHGWINGHPVTFALGFGSKEGETLLCDGHVTEDDFFQRDASGRYARGHNHYGKGRGPHDNAHDIGKYTGPGY